MTDYRDAINPVLRALRRMPDTIDRLAARLTRYDRDAIEGAVSHICATMRGYSVDYITDDGIRVTRYYAGQDGIPADRLATYRAQR